MVCLECWLPVVFGSMALVTVASPVWAKTPAEIEAIAKASTVKIVLGENNNGTGVIVHRQGQVYSLVTNRHVVCGASLCSQLPEGSQYRLSLPDGQQMKVNAKNIQLLGQDLDLAVIRFTSKRNYPIAKVSAPSQLKVEDNVFTAGFPAYRGFSFSQGKVIAVVNRRIQGDRGGYSVIYNATTLPGMSGGGVFNSDGNLVAIHGVGDRYKPGTDIGDDYRINSKIGFNRGIPVRWLVQSLGEEGIIVGARTSLSVIRATSNGVPEVADEYFIIGFNKFVEPGVNFIAGKREAIQQFTRAIQLNPNYINAYYLRAYTYHQVGDFQESLGDINKTIAFNPDDVAAYTNRGILKADKLNDSQCALADFNKAVALNPNFAGAYTERGILKADKLNDSQGALADFNKAIALNPDYAFAYKNRGLLKANKLNDLQGALADFNTLINLNPDYAFAYKNRGLLKADKLNDPQGALADFNTIINLNPGNADSYYDRGVLKHQKLNDSQGALADFNQAISLNPYYANAYSNRGVLKNEKLNDSQGALVDYNKAIQINPDFAAAYVNRGLLKENKLNDSQGALADYDKAISLNPNLAEVYSNRGNLKYQKLNDFQGALADYNKTIQINPQFINAYVLRGLLKATQLNDRSGGITDLRQAARLARTQGNTQILQAILKILNQLGATE